MFLDDRCHVLDAVPHVDTLDGGRGSVRDGPMDDTTLCFLLLCCTLELLYQATTVESWSIQWYAKSLQTLKKVKALACFLLDYINVPCQDRSSEMFRIRYIFA